MSVYVGVHEESVSIETEHCTVLLVVDSVC